VLEDAVAEPALRELHQNLAWWPPASSPGAHRLGADDLPRRELKKASETIRNRLLHVAAPSCARAALILRLDETGRGLNAPAAFLRLRTAFP